MSDQRISASPSYPIQPPPPSNSDFTPALAVHFTVGIDPASFTLVFSQPVMSPAATAGIAAARLVPSLAVSLSPILAKDLMKILQRSVEQYERHVGPIPDMPSVPIPTPPPT